MITRLVLEELGGLDADPAVSAPGTARMYFNRITGTIRISRNGSPFVDRGVFPSLLVGTPDFNIELPEIFDTVPTNDATPTTLATIDLSAQAIYKVTVNATAHEGTTGDVAERIRIGTFRTDGPGPTAQIGATIDGDQGIMESPAATNWDLTFLPSATNLLVQGTGEIGKDIDWDLKVEIEKTAYDTPGGFSPIDLSPEGWWRGDLGVIGSPVSTWEDQSGNGRDYVQGTVARQPLYLVAGGPGGRPALAFDGVDDRMDIAAYSPAAPGTTPFYVWMIVRQESWTNISRLFGCVSGGVILTVQQAPAIPDLRMVNGVVANQVSALPVGTWGRLETVFTNSITDFLKVIATEVGGSTAGNSTGTGRQLAANANGSHSHITVAEMATWHRVLTGPERAQLDAYATARYGPGLV